MIAICAFLMPLAFVSCGGAKQEPMELVIERGLANSKQQALLMAKSLEDKDGELPRTFEDSILKTCNYRAWISGFFPGTLWYLFSVDSDKELLSYAQMYTERVEEAKHVTTNHDLGFMLNCSFGNGYRLTGNEQYLDVMKTGAQSLASRFNPNMQLIKSWETSKKWQYPVIIDNMMNLEFLCFMAKETGVVNYLDIANQHAQKTLINHFRPDYSCYHVVSYDTITGMPHF
ncbi:glycosyl hydrolase family 88 [Mangrovibacterium marinum]|uniref:Glycosyl hydrolase family 88 n=2 Tax=Mangrovibacterium marinum TaxID=1639118 RepID=A0A2T5BXP0_9BACT|nr:glycosyl hydrolase family 88 [Mangrovibacterium marinum]